MTVTRLKDQQVGCHYAIPEFGRTEIQRGRRRLPNQFVPVGVISGLDIPPFP